MALSGGDVCTAIITKGIGCLPACESMITSQLSIAGLCDVRVIGPTGGSHPLAPGEIANLYQPVDPPPGMEDHPAFYRPEDPRDPFSIKHPVRIVLKFRGMETEREYIVSQRRATMVVKVINMINNTHERLSVIASELKKVAKRSVNVLKFRKKR